jgi:hypothetical protein
MTLRNRLLTAFIASTLLPLAATVWITTTLLDRSLRYATTGELDRLSRTLENTAKLFYQRERDALKEDALAGRTPPTTYEFGSGSPWPDPVRAFWESGEPERFGVSGAGGARVDYMRRLPAGSAKAGIEVYSRDLGGVSMEELSTQLRETRRLVNALDARDLRRGFTLTLLLLLGAAWLVSLLPLVLLARRVSQPMQQLTAALTDFAGGNWSRRIGRTEKPSEGSWNSPDLSLSAPSERAQHASHANGARRRSGARESVWGSPRGEAPRLVSALWAPLLRERR